jgi:hypothetical protein
LARSNVPVLPRSLGIAGEFAENPDAAGTLCRSRIFTFTNESSAGRIASR